MTKRAQKETENEDANKEEVLNEEPTEEQDEAADQSEDDQVNDEGAEDSGDEQDDDGKQAEQAEKDLEAQKKRELYEQRKAARQKQVRQNALQEKADEGTATKEEKDELSQLKNSVAALQQFVQPQIERQLVQGDEQAYKLMEADYVQAYPEYTSDMERAKKALLMRLKADGLSDDEASYAVRREMMVQANLAHRSGLDPVEHLHNEAKKINGWLDQYVQEMGYAPTKAIKTNLQAQRAASRPNAMIGGAGKGANASVKKFSEMGDDDLEEIKNTTIWDAV